MKLDGEAMTPAERGARAARVCSCKSCRPRLARVVEAEIREAAKPLVEALKVMLAWFEAAGEELPGDPWPGPDDESEEAEFEAQAEALENFRAVWRDVKAAISPWEEQ